MNINFWLLRVSRWSGYVLLVLLIIYIVTGYSMVGFHGMNRLVEKSLAVFLHLNLDWVLIIFIMIHGGIEIYFALRRKGILK